MGGKKPRIVAFLIAVIAIVISLMTVIWIVTGKSIAPAAFIPSREGIWPWLLGYVALLTFYIAAMLISWCISISDEYKSIAKGFTVAGASAFAIAWVLVLALFCAPALLHHANSFLEQPSSPWLTTLLTLRNNFANYYWIPLLLGFILALAYIWTRKEEKFYQDVIFPRQTVWATFAAVVLMTLWLTTALGIDMKQQAIAVQPLLHHAAQTAADLKDAIADAEIKSTPLSNRTPVTGTVKFDVPTSSISYTVYPEFESAPDLQTITVTFAITNTGLLAADALITPTVTGRVNFDFNTASISDTANTENGAAPNLSPLTLTLAIVSPLPVNASESSSSAVTGTVQFDFGTSSISDTILTKIITASNRLTIPATFAFANTAPPADAVLITPIVKGTVNFGFDTSSISDTASIVSNLPAITLTLAIEHIAPSTVAPANLSSQWITATAYAGHLIADTAELSQTILAATATDSDTVTRTANYGDLLRFATVSIASLARQLSSELQGRDISADGIGSSHRASLIAIITATFDSLTNMNTLPYFTIAVLYSVFLLMPWLIYIVYITGRRGKVTAITRKDMADFDLLAEFLRPEPNDDDDVVTAKQWSKASTSVQFGEENDDTARRVFSYATYTDHKAMSPARPLSKEAKQEAEMFVIGRAQFYSRQYLIPLILLTVISAIGWYYTFLAGTLTDVYEFVKQGGSTSTLNDLLTRNVTPFTAAFLGGWIFVIVMLFNNWTRDDLYPRSFFYAAAHLMIALIVGFVFATALSQGSSPWIEIPVTAAALLISVVPYDSIGLFTQQWIQSRKKAIDPGSKEGDNTAWISHELRTVPGVSIWDETRLHQEGIDSMVDLAGANLERLVLQTQYTAETIADWVDTALLRSHLSTAMIGYLATVNISTATDLILACCVAQNTGFWYEVGTSERARKAMVTDWQVGAMKGANTVAQTVAGVAKLSEVVLEGEKPLTLPPVASLDQALRYALASFAPEHNLSNILHFRLSTLKKPITSDPRLAEICEGLNRLMEISGLDIKDDVDGSKFKANGKEYVETIRKCIETFSFAADTLTIYAWSGLHPAVNWLDTLVAGLNGAPVAEENKRELERAVEDVKNATKKFDEKVKAPAPASDWAVICTELSTQLQRIVSPGPGIEVGTEAGTLEDYVKKIKVIDAPLLTAAEPLIAVDLKPLQARIEELDKLVKGLPDANITDVDKNKVKDAVKPVTEACKELKSSVGCL